MGMALKADVARVCKKNGTNKPIDLVHLSGITLGDSALENEVLSMFAAHMPSYLSMLEAARSDEEIRRAAHTLKGAAKNIGAFQLAELALECEETRNLELAPFVSEMERIKAYIAELVG